MRQLPLLENENDDLQIWTARLDALSRGDLIELASHLSTDELAKADKFASERDRNRSIGARGVLRCLLGRVLGLPPEDLSFIYGEHGKPCLLISAPTLPVHFNVAHTDDMLVVAITRYSCVGIDVERIRPNAHWRAIARRHYHVREISRLDLLSEDAKLAAFYRIWTAKEAFLKATGRGLTFPLQDVEVDLLDDLESVRILSIAGNTIEASRWRASPVNVDSDFVATIVREGRLLVK